MFSSFHIKMAQFSFALMNSVWRFHAREMPAGVYDVLIEQSGGYQLSTEGPIYYIFVGV